MQKTRLLAGPFKHLLILSIKIKGSLRTIEYMKAIGSSYLSRLFTRRTSMTTYVKCRFYLVMVIDIDWCNIWNYGFPSPKNISNFKCGYNNDSIVLIGFYSHILIWVCQQLEGYAWDNHHLTYLREIGALFYVVSFSLQEPCI